MSQCMRCGASFRCGMADGGDAPCWCTALPPLPRSAYVPEAGKPAGASCFCPACLRALLEAQRSKDAAG